MELNMNNTKTNVMNCKTAGSVLPDLLFDPGSASAEARQHLATCSHCQQELQSLQQTMSMLDTWEAPEPSPFWNARMGAMLREEQARPASGWAGFKESLRTRFWLSNRSLRPAAGAAALGLLLAIGGGTWLDLANQPAVIPSKASNTVRDLQSLNENAQVFQQISALDESDAATGEATSQ